MEQMEQMEAVRRIAERMLRRLEALEQEQIQWQAASRGMIPPQQQEPVRAWLESCWDFGRQAPGRFDGSPLYSSTEEHWGALLCYGAPTAGLELAADGRAVVWATLRTPPVRVPGRLPVLASQLLRLGL